MAEQCCETCALWDYKGAYESNKVANKLIEGKLPPDAISFCHWEFDLSILPDSVGVITRRKLKNNLKTLTYRAQGGDCPCYISREKTNET